MAYAASDAVPGRRPEGESVTNEEIALAVFEAFDEKVFDGGTSLVSDDCVITEVATGEAFRGPDGLREQYEKWATAFPDGHSIIRNVFSAGECVTIESTWHGTHSGPWRTPSGEIPASGKHVTFDYCTFSRIVDGQEVEGRHYFDTDTILRQMGVER